MNEQQLLCARCLLQGKRAPAITVANGHALCQIDFNVTAIYRTSNGGTPALSLAGDDRMSPG